MSSRLSLRKKGCTAVCCDRGSPYVRPEERDRIVRDMGVDVFVPEGEHYLIGKNTDGSLRDLETEPCPFLTDDRLCSIQQAGYEKPDDCSMHPLFWKRENGRLQPYVITCCDGYQCIDDTFVADAKERFARFSKEQQQELFASQEWFCNFGFRLERYKP